MRVRDTFDTDEKCGTYLEAARWPEGVRCPRCGGDKISKFASRETQRRRFSKKQGKLIEVRVPPRRLYQCRAPECRHQFSATTGTMFAGSHIPLRVWFRAIAMTATSKQELSATEIQSELGVSYKTAWYLTHRLREAIERAQRREGSASSGSSAGAWDDRQFRESSR